MSLPVAFFFSFVDQGGTFYPSQIHVAGILLIGLLMGLKKKEEMFILGNIFSTMLFVFGMINLYAMPGTNATTSLATFPLTLLPSFSLVLLAYAVVSFVRVFYALKKEDHLTKDHEEKHKVNFFLVPISYLASIGLYVLINASIRVLYPFNGGSGSGELIVWDNWHYQNDVLMFVSLVFIALAFISIPIFRGILKNKNGLVDRKN